MDLSDEEDDVSTDITEPKMTPDIVVSKKPVKLQQPIVHHFNIDNTISETIDMSFMNIGDLTAVNNTLVDQVIDQLNEPILSIQCHKLYFDNYFSTYQVFEILKALEINLANKQVCSPTVSNRQRD